jgi:hypothetical protein
MEKGEKVMMRPLQNVAAALLHSQDLPLHQPVKLAVRCRLASSRQLLAVGSRAKRPLNASVVSALWVSVETTLQSLILKASPKPVIQWRQVVARIRRQRSKASHPLGLPVFDLPISLVSPLRMSVPLRMQD